MSVKRKLHHLARFMKRSLKNATIWNLKRSQHSPREYCVECMHLIVKSTTNSFRFHTEWQILSLLIPSPRQTWHLYSWPFELATTGQSLMQDKNFEHGVDFFHVNEHQPQFLGRGKIKIKMSEPYKRMAEDDQSLSNTHGLECMKLCNWLQKHWQHKSEDCVSWGSLSWITLDSELVGQVSPQERLTVPLNGCDEIMYTLAWNVGWIVQAHTTTPYHSNLLLQTDQR